MRAPAPKIPVAVLTGFLGSGKTSILNRLVRDPAMANALVVVNEFGEIGLDHELIATPGEVVLLRSGCLCCTLRSDLVETLASAAGKADRGEVPAFDRVVVETTGLAEPEPILQALMADPFVASRFTLASVIAALDAVHGRATLARHLEAAKQVAVADRLLVTKTDLAGAAELDRLEAVARSVNPRAPLTRMTLDTPLDAGLLWSGGADWTISEGSEPLQAHAHHHHHHHDRVRSFSFAFDEPIPAAALDAWLVQLLELQGPDLLRFKALVNVAELPGPLVLHGVQHVLHPPATLKEWPSADRRTRMVFITSGIDPERLCATLTALRGATELAEAAVPA